MAGFSALVTLDTTALSEEALSVVPFLRAAGLKHIHLISVEERLESTHKASLASSREGETQRLNAYLAAKAKQLETEGLTADFTVRTGRPAEEVLEVVMESRPDLVVIATHGRAGIQRWQLGSVADKIIRGAPCPTLVIGPNVEASRLATFEVKRVLVPLDGSELAEKALPVASLLARSCGAAIDLVQVVHMPNTWAADPIYVPDPSLILDDLEAVAKDYLERKLTGENVSRTVLRTIQGRIATELQFIINDRESDLVVMTSHARHGVPRFVLGSVADELLRGPVPVLIIRADEEVPAALSSSD